MKGPRAILASTLDAQRKLTWTPQVRRVIVMAFSALCKGLLESQEAQNHRPVYLEVAQIPVEETHFCRPLAFEVDLCETMAP